MTADPKELGFDKGQEYDWKMSAFTDLGIDVVTNRALWSLTAPDGRKAMYWHTTGNAWAFGKKFKPHSAHSLAAALASGRIAMPSDARGAYCKGCKAQIFWVMGQKPRGLSEVKPMPLNPDGSSHFSTCPNAERFRMEGVANSPFKWRYMYMNPAGNGHEIVWYNDITAKALRSLLRKGKQLIDARYYIEGDETTYFTEAALANALSVKHKHERGRKS